MKSYQHNKAHNKFRIEARIKVKLRQNLSWLWGYPLAPLPSTQHLQWRSLYLPSPWEVKTLTIDGKNLSSTLYSRNKLIKDFPISLTRVVGDIDQWSQHIALKHQAIKMLLDRETVDPIRVLLQPLLSTRDYKNTRNILQQQTELTSSIKQLAWWLSGDTTQFIQAIHWINQEATALIAIKKNNLNHDIFEDLILKLFALRQKVGDKACQNLLLIFASPDWHTAKPRISLSPQQAADEKFQDTFFTERRFITSSDGDLIQELSHWLDQILLLSTKQARQSMRVINSMLPEQTITAYSHCWSLYDDLQALLKTHDKQALSKKPWRGLLTSHDEIISERNKLLATIADYPLPTFDPNMLSSIINWFVKNTTLFNGLNQLIKAIKIDDLPTDSPWRTPHLKLYMMTAWYRCFKKIDDHSFRHLINKLPTFIHFIKRGSTPQHYRLTLFSDVFNFKPGRLEICRAYQDHQLDSYLKALTHFTEITQHTLTTDYIDYIDTIFNDFKPERVNWQDITPYIQEMMKQNIDFQWIYEDEWYNLHRIAKGDSKLFIQNLHYWGTFDSDDDKPHSKVWEELDPNLLPIAAQLHEQGLSHIANAVAESKEYFRLEKIIKLSTLQKSLNIKETQPVQLHTSSTDWIKTYPCELYPALKRLNQYHADSFTIAAKITAHDIPSSQAILREIEAINKVILEKKSQNINTTELQTRCDNLQKRLTNPIKPSQTKLDKLSKKIEHQAYLHFLEQWQHNIESNFQHDLETTFHIKAEHFTKTQQMALTGFLSLSTTTKEVVCQLLQTRSQSKPWDLRDHPKNVGFLSQLRQQGINTKPWLDGLDYPEQVLADNDGQSLQLFLKFEEDPFEIFQMGSHFNTCLSVFNFNYFSVVANAADINKRVLYLRKADGHVVGRCLFALNNQGQLLTFTRYTHLKNGSLDSLIDDFADQLAQEMNTVRSDQGTTSTLVAHDWYDDGAHAFDKDDSEQLDNNLSKILLNLPLEQAQEYIKTLLSNALLPSIIIENILAMPVLEQRPSLAKSLVSPLIKLGNRQDDMRLSTAEFLLAAGERSQAVRLIKNFSLYRDHYGDTYCPFDYQQIKRIINISPTLARRLLLKSRRLSGVSKTELDTSQERLQLLINVYRQLHRPKQMLACQNVLNNLK